MPTTAELVWLIAGVANGDLAAFERLYAGTSAKLYGVILRILPHRARADDVLLETFLTIRAQAGTFDPAYAAPLPWMVAIARNRAIDIVRHEAALPIETEIEALVTAEQPAPAERPEINEGLKRLLACLGRLDAKLQRMMLHAYYSGLSRDALAQEFGLAADDVKEALQNALADIRVCIET